MQAKKTAKAPNVTLIKPMPEEGAEICCVNRTFPGQQRRRFLLLCADAAGKRVQNISANTSRRIDREYDIDVEAIVLRAYEEPAEIVCALALAMFGRETALTCRVLL